MKLILTFRKKSSFLLKEFFQINWNWILWPRPPPIVLAFLSLGITVFWMFLEGILCTLGFKAILTFFWRRDVIQLWWNILAEMVLRQKHLQGLKRYYCITLYLNHKSVNVLDPGLSVGILCNHPCPSVICDPSALKSLRDHPLFFLFFA